MSDVEAREDARRVTGRSLLLFLLERGGAAAQPHPERKPEKRDVPQKK